MHNGCNECHCRGCMYVYECVRVKLTSAQLHSCTTAHCTCIHYQVSFWLGIPFLVFTEQTEYPRTHTRTSYTDYIYAISSRQANQPTPVDWQQKAFCGTHSTIEYMKSRVPVSVVRRTVWVAIYTYTSFTVSGGKVEFHISLIDDTSIHIPYFLSSLSLSPVHLIDDIFVVFASHSSLHIATCVCHCRRRHHHQIYFLRFSICSSLLNSMNETYPYQLHRVGQSLVSLSRCSNNTHAHAHSAILSISLFCSLRLLSISLVQLFYCYLTHKHTHERHRISTKNKTSTKQHWPRPELPSKLPPLTTMHREFHQWIVTTSANSLLFAIW